MSNFVHFIAVIWLFVVCIKQTFDENNKQSVFIIALHEYVLVGR